jgi:tripartite-type tricarboxylate transporter receptor subunit TctC
MADIRKRGRRAVLLAAAALPVAGLARGQEAAGGTTRIVIPYAPGGGSDILARPILPKLTERLRQAVIVDNRPGAAGNLGAAQVARAAPDGLTLLLANNSHTINPFMYRNVGYDLAQGFEPISLLGTSPLIVVVPESVPVRSIADLVALAKQRPGALNFGSPGAGTPGHLAAALFNTLAGINSVHVSYPGSGPTTVALLQAQVQYSFSTPAAVEPHIRSGRMRALAVTSRERFDAFPEVPALAESGIAALADFDVAVWWGLLAPAGTDPRVLDRLNEAVREALSQTEIRDNWAARGMLARYTSRDAFRTLIAAELTRWQRVVADNGITLD